jgi:hypothetical protein
MLNLQQIDHFRLSSTEMLDKAKTLASDKHFSLLLKQCKIRRNKIL